MKNTLSILLVSMILFGCNKDLKKYYPYGWVKMKNGESKEYSPLNEIYIDKSKINNFELYMIYNTIDTVFDEYRDKTEKIYIVDTLKFEITNSDDLPESLKGIVKSEVKSLNNKYLSENEYDIFTDYVKLPTDIRVYDGEDIKVIITKDGEILESYTVDLKHNKDGSKLIDYQYIINPMSKSKFKLSSIQYNGFIDIKKIKPKIYSRNFIKIKGKKIDFFLITPPDTLSYSYKTYDGYKLDPCEYGCEKSVITQIK